MYIDILNEGYGAYMFEPIWQEYVLRALIGSCLAGNFGIRVGNASYRELVRRGGYDFFPHDFRNAQFWTEIEARHPRSHECTRLKLLQMPSGMGSMRILEELQSQGLRAATLPELLVFGARTATVLFQWEIVALGTRYYLQPCWPRVLALCGRNVRAKQQGWRDLEWRS